MLTTPSSDRVKLAWPLWDLLRENQRVGAIRDTDISISEKNHQAHSMGINQEPHVPWQQACTHWLMSR